MITRPIIVVGAPRSGTTLFFRFLAHHPLLWHLPGESHGVLEGPFHPKSKAYASNRVTADELSEAVAGRLRETFFRQAINLNVVISDPSWFLSGAGLGRRLAGRVAVAALGRLSSLKKPDAIRLLEKTPKNSLRVSMLAKLFPDASFIWLKRRARPTIDSLISGWQAVDRLGPVARDRFARSGYALGQRLQLTDYHGARWKFALVPGWDTLRGKSVADAAALQYLRCNETIGHDFQQLPRERTLMLRFEDFVARPLASLAPLLEQLDLKLTPVMEQLAHALPPVNTTRDAATRESARLRHRHAVEDVIERYAEIRRLEELMGYDAEKVSEERSGCG